MRCELNCAALASLLAYADRRYALSTYLVISESDVRGWEGEDVSECVDNSPIVGQPLCGRNPVHIILTPPRQRSAK